MTVRLWTPAAVLVVALCACRRPAPPDKAAPALAGPAGPTASATERCRTGPGIVVAPLVVEWQEGESVQRVSLGADGRVRNGTARLGDFVGACLLDARGNVVFAVDTRGGITAADGASAGAFHAHQPLQIDGQSVVVTEVIEDTDGQGSGVDDAGTVYVVPRSGESSSTPAHVEGDVRRARRAALLLLEARGGFGR